MRNAVIRKRRLRTQRLLDEWMRTPQRIMVPQLDYRDINIKALQESRLWAIPEGPRLSEVSIEAMERTAREAQ